VTPTPDFAESTFNGAANALLANNAAVTSAILAIIVFLVSGCIYRTDYAF
jgi:hypothetical protein